MTNEEKIQEVEDKLDGRITVCKDCYSPVEFKEKEGVWRHKSDSNSDESSYLRSFFCNGYGYPIPETSVVKMDL